MAKRGELSGSIKGKSQVLNTKTDRFVKRDAATGQFQSVKGDKEPYKNVRKEK